jgi:hypothetical protein
VQVTVGRRNVPKGRLWNPMEKSKWTEVSSTVNYTQILFHVGRGHPQNVQLWSAGGHPQEGNTLKFCGVKIYYQLFFSCTHYLVDFYLIGNHSVWRTLWLHRPKCCL